MLKLANTDTINSAYTNRQNRNGEYLADFSLENRFACLNTKFQKSREIYRLTSTQITKAQLDYIFINEI